MKNKEKEYDMFKAQRIDQDWLNIEEDILHGEHVDAKTGEEFYLEERFDFEIEGLPLNISKNNDYTEDLSKSISNISFDADSNIVSFDVSVDEDSEESPYYSGFALLFTEEEIDHVLSNVEDMDFFFKVAVPGTNWFIGSYGHID